MFEQPVQDLNSHQYLFARQKAYCPSQQSLKDCSNIYFYLQEYCLQSYGNPYNNCAHVLQWLDDLLCSQNLNPGLQFVIPQTLYSVVLTVSRKFRLSLHPLKWLGCRTLVGGLLVAILTTQSLNVNVYSYSHSTFFVIDWHMFTP